MAPSTAVRSVHRVRQAEGALHSTTYRFKPGVKEALRNRQQRLDPEVNQIAMKAQQRLHRKYWGLLGRGKQTTVAATAVAREMLGFIWSIACQVEQPGRKVAA